MASQKKTQKDSQKASKSKKPADAAPKKAPADAAPARLPAVAVTGPDPLRPASHVTSAILAVGLVAMGFLAARAHTQTLLVVTLLALGGLAGWLTWESWRGSRAA